MYELWQYLNQRQRAGFWNFSAFFLCWFLVYLPALPSFFFFYDDAVSFYLTYPNDLTYTGPGPADLTVVEVGWSQQGRFLAGIWDYLSNFLGIEMFLSDSQNWIGGIFTVLASMTLLYILRVRFDLKNYPLLTLSPCLYIITAPCFAEIQFLHSAVAIYTLSTLLSIVAYRLVWWRSLGCQVLSSLCNLAAFCLTQVSGMIFYCLLIIDFLTQDMYEQKEQRPPLGRSWKSLGFYSSSLVIYAVIYLISRRWLQGPGDRSIPSFINLDFIKGKVDLVFQVFDTYLNSAYFAPPLWVYYLEGLLAITVVVLVVRRCRQPRSLKTTILKVLGLALGLVSLTIASTLPLLVVPENWPSLRVCVTMSLSLIVLCVVAARNFPPQSFYVKGLALTLVFYMFVQALNTLEQGTKRVLISQRDEQTILRIASLNADHGVHQAQVVLGKLTTYNPYHIPGRLSYSDVLSSSTLQFDNGVDTYLRLNGVGQVITVSDTEQKQMNQTYCQGALPMTPVWMGQGLTILCR